MKDPKADLRDRISIYGPAALLVVLAFAVAFYFVKPAPPTRVLMSTGDPAGAYQAFAERYAGILAREGIELVLMPSAGSVENVGRLIAGEADVALVQGGTALAGESSGLHALGSVFFEPLWLFHRQGLELDRLPGLAGLRVAVGPPGSGTHELVTRLLEDNGVLDRVILRDEGGEAAVRALELGELDAVFLVSSAASELVDRLLRDPEVELASFERAEAYVRRYRYLSSVSLPEGAVDLAANLPQRPIRLLAPAASLVGVANLHPAITDLMLQAADQVHGSGGWFERAGQFPSGELIDYPLSKEASRYYKFGPPLLQRFLPFWVASLVDRLKVMLLPLVVLMLPLFKVMPPIYSWRMRARIYRWYDRLEEVDFAFKHDDAGNLPALLAELDRLEQDVRRVQVPLSFASQLYHLRQHIDLVRQKIQDGI